MFVADHPAILTIKKSSQNKATKQKVALSALKTNCKKLMFYSLRMKIILIFAPDIHVKTKG